MLIRPAGPDDLPAVAAIYNRGFDEVGTMREVGHKHDRWIDVTWLQRRL